MNDVTHTKEQEETRQQGSAAFPCAMYFSRGRKGQPSFTLSPHWHSSTELIHLQEGTYYAAINRETFTVTQDAYIFVESGMLHAVYSQPRFKESALLFDPAILSTAYHDASDDDIIEPLSHGTLSFPRLITKDMPVFHDFDQLYRRIEAVFTTENDRRDDQYIIRGASSQLKVKAYMMLLLDLLTEAGLMQHTGYDLDPKAESLKTVITYIAEHHNEKIYLADLAAMMNLSEQYFSRFFKKMIGKNCMDYINDVRIRHAKKLLATTTDPVLQIAYECGFSNIGHFINTFKKATGMKPLEYRLRK